MSMMEKNESVWITDFGRFDGFHRSVFSLLAKNFSVPSLPAAALAEVGAESVEIRDPDNK